MHSTTLSYSTVCKTLYMSSLLTEHCKPISTFSQLYQEHHPKTWNATKHMQRLSHQLSPKINCLAKTVPKKGDANYVHEYTNTHKPNIRIVHYKTSWIFFIGNCLSKSRWSIEVKYLQTRCRKCTWLSVYQIIILITLCPWDANIY